MQEDRSGDHRVFQTDLSETCDQRVLVLIFISWYSAYDAVFPDLKYQYEAERVSDLNADLRCGNGWTSGSHPLPSGIFLKLYVHRAVSIGLCGYAVCRLLSDPLCGSKEKICDHQCRSFHWSGGSRGCAYVP